MKTRKLILSILLLLNSGTAFLKAQSVTDIDGNVYKTSTIGTQTWMVENLKTTKLNDGTEITLASLDANDWANHTVAASTTPAFCWLYDSASVYKDIYGAFYNGFAVSTGNLCPLGWHVPSDDEWATLANYLGGENVAGGKLKDSNPRYWQQPNNGATNSSGFTARASGSITDNGSNWDVAYNAYFWSATTHNETDLGVWVINFNQPLLSAYYQSKQMGNPLRCISNVAAKALVPNAANSSTQLPPEFVTISNNQYRFSATVPKLWSFSQIEQQDPYEEFKNGSYSASMSTDAGDEVPENWNGFRLGSTGPSNDRSPYLVIYAHKVDDQKPEEFEALFEKSLTNMGIKEIDLNRNFSVNDAVGFDCIYNLGIKVRYTVLYKNGIRVVAQYYFPSNDPESFNLYTSEVDAIIKSLRIN